MTAIIAAALVTGNSQSHNKESANGNGKMLNAVDTHSRFTFNAKRDSNGKITGQAMLRIPAFKSGNGQDEFIKFDISCMRVIGSTAIFGRTVKRKNCQTDVEAAYFAVEDENGGQDKIFRGFYFDDDPATKGEADLCQTIERKVLVFKPIVEGEIKVKK